MTADSPETSAPPPIGRDPVAARRQFGWVACVIVLIAAFWLHALLASADKSSTMDEPVHTFSAWLTVNQRDFRLNREHPALWKTVIGLATIGQPLHPEPDSPAALAVLKKTFDYANWVTQVLYHDPMQPTPLYGEHLVERARIANSIFLILMAGIVARWAWVWGGPWAAVVATGLLAFDPNFLGHGGLATNDVAISSVIAAATFCLWRLGERFTWPRVIGLALLCSAAWCIKLSSILLPAMLGVPLLYRVVAGGDWPSRNGTGVMRTRWSRLAAAAATCGAIVVVAFAFIWTLYGFRFAPTPDGRLLDDAFIDPYARYDLAISRATAAAGGRRPDDAWIDAHLGIYRPTLLAKACWALERAKVLPQAWTYGLNFTIARSISRDSFLLGQLSHTGFTWFFPLTVLFKTPATTLGLAACCGAIGVAQMHGRLRNAPVRWKAICLIVPPVVFFTAAAAGNVNIGIRHILPVFPPVFVACGVVVARVVAKRPQLKPLVPAVLSLLAIETCSVFPNYINFFNRPSGGEAGGFKLLSDSNLDWGQDLPALSRWYANWRHANPDRPFRFLQFGSVDPAVYGIGVGGPTLPIIDSPQADLQPGVYAVSATLLQGIAPGDLIPTLLKLRTRRPIAVLNGTIYIFDCQ